MFLYFLARLVQGEGLRVIPTHLAVTGSYRMFPLFERHNGPDRQIRFLTSNAKIRVRIGSR
jgi:hypothetical protein